MYEFFFNYAITFSYYCKFVFVTKLVLLLHKDVFS